MIIAKINARVNAIYSGLGFDDGIERIGINMILEPRDTTKGVHYQEELQFRIKNLTGAKLDSEVEVIVQEKEES